MTLVQSKKYESTTITNLLMILSECTSNSGLSYRRNVVKAFESPMIRSLCSKYWCYKSTTISVKRTPNFQILDRFSFQRFLGLSVSDKVPDKNTIWLFKQRLGEDDVEALFDHFSTEA